MFRDWLVDANSAQVAPQEHLQVAYIHLPCVVQSASVPSGGITPLSYLLAHWPEPPHITSFPSSTNAANACAFACTVRTRVSFSATSAGIFPPLCSLPNAIKLPSRKTTAPAFAVSKVLVTHTIPIDCIFDLIGSDIQAKLEGKSRRHGQATTLPDHINARYPNPSGKTVLTPISSDLTSTSSSSWHGVQRLISSHVACEPSGIVPPYCELPHTTTVPCAVNARNVDGFGTTRTISISCA